MKIEDGPKISGITEKSRSLINQHDAVMDTMRFKINGEFTVSA